MRRISTFRTPLFLCLLVAALLATGCVSAVREETQAAHQRIDQLEDQIERNQTDLANQERRLGVTEKNVEGASKTALEALDRAIAAGKLAEGKLVFETVLSDDRVRFGFDHADLGPDATKALDEFAKQLTEADAEIYIEIQGHTDSTGEERYNYDLGEERAEAVRRYLNRHHSLPLHRMAVISYGETAPVADNGSRDGRAQNRRVQLVVLR